MPRGYLNSGGSGMLGWNDAERLLQRATRFWIATTDRGGRPHLVQQWGAWIDGTLYFEGSPKTRWARNLARDRRVGFGTDRGTLVLLAEGVAGPISRPERTLAERVARSYGAKYGRTFDYRPKPEQWTRGGLWAVRATKLFVWDVRTFNRSATRFRF